MPGYLVQYKGTSTCSMCFVVSFAKSVSFRDFYFLFYTDSKPELEIPRNSFLPTNGWLKCYDVVRVLCTRVSFRTRLATPTTHSFFLLLQCKFSSSYQPDTKIFCVNNGRNEVNESKQAMNE